jgi:hypothetical protein
MLEFEQGGLFHVPLRCGNFSGRGDLCDSCLKREEKTREKVAKITGTTIEGMHPALLMGRVTEPIPFWSRIYDGAWFRLKIEGGYTLSKEVMAKAKKAAEVAYKDVETVAPQPMPTKRGAGAKKKVLAPVVAAAPAAPLAPVVAEAPKPPAKKATKRATVVVAPPVATVNTSESPLPVEEVFHVKIRKQEVDGRALYLDPQKNKLYDLKLNYIGRLKDGAIVSFPDSDAEA